jgi:hypothetical protein
MEIINMTLVRYAALLSFVLFTNPAAACEDPPEAEKLHLSSSQSMKVNVLVESVDRETREVNLRDDSGELISFIAGDEIQNFDQLNAGDMVVAEYTENFYIDVVDADGATPSEGEFTAVGSAKLGHKPGMTAFDSTIVTAMVEAIDLDAGTYTLKWPDGSTETLVAQNPENLTKGEVGDLVIITNTVSINISVEETE